MMPIRSSSFTPCAAWASCWNLVARAATLDSPHSGSILRKLQSGFALAAVLLAGLMALFMDRALHRSLEAEDAQVMEGQARALLGQLAAGKLNHDPEGSPILEKASWRVLDRSGRVISQSQDSSSLPAFPVTAATGRVQEVEAAGGGVYSVLNRPWSHGMDQGLLQLVMDRTHEEALVRGFRHTLLLVVVAAMVLAALLARAIARWGLAPLGAIVQEAGFISDQNLDHRLAAANFPLELQELVATLNAALSRLQEAFDRLGNLGAELAHELRTPLQNLRSTLENRILRGGADPVEPSELGLLIEDCDRMAALIEQILFLARTEHSPEGLARSDISAQELLEEVRCFFEAAAEETGVDLQVQADPGITVRGDRLLLTRALHNLSSNALRHAPRGGWVILGARELQGRVALSVEDNGTGISEAWIPKLGTPFVRPPEARPSEGHGLGLAIVRRIAVMLGGEMILESRVGQGTRVQIQIPRT
jgi:two-component system heavy metal sensor histidine kinase CusS